MSHVTGAVHLTRSAAIHSVAAAVLLAGVCATAHAWSAGPPDGHSGDPPNNRTCVFAGCHESFPLNSGDGSLAIQGLPGTYVPDEVYELTIAIADPGQERWGFQGTVIRPDDGLQAGTLAPGDPDLVQVSEGPGTQRDYIKHRLEGTFNGQPEGASWQILWTAPAAGSGPAHFYFAGNAANGDFFNTGDYIYAINVQIPESSPGAVEPGDLAGNSALSVSPHPLTSTGTLRFELPAAGSTDLRIVDSAGRLVRRLAAGPREAGVHGAQWDLRDEEGRPVPSGVFHAVLISGDVRIARRVVVLRQ